jgi:hypothetical protein
LPYPQKGKVRQDKPDSAARTHKKGSIMQPKHTQTRFLVGDVVATRGALQSMAEASQDPSQFVQRHRRGDWGDMSDDNKRENEFSVVMPAL